jgi:hypothetical protein
LELELEGVVDIVLFLLASAFRWLDVSVWLLWW